METGSSKDFTAYGVDGCKAGWFYIGFGPSKKICWGIVRTIDALVEKAKPDDRIFIDIPIGLPKNRLGRDCEREARLVLGAPLGSSVFLVPPRAVLDHSHDYDLANRWCKELTGKGLSKQTFALLPKIKEVDCLLQACPRARSVVREVHPEVCFWALAGSGPVQYKQYKKKILKGYLERIAILREYWSSISENIEAILEDETVLEEHTRGNLDGDDILDAAAAAVTALADKSVLRTLPGEPPKDDCGLPMEMVYVRRDEFRTVWGNPCIFKRLQVWIRKWKREIVLIGGRLARLKREISS